MLREMGAAVCFNYTQEGVEERITARQAHIPYIYDCIGSLKGSLTPLTKIAGEGSKVAVLLPIITARASTAEAPEYEMDVNKVLVGQWDHGVEVRGVRTHYYAANEFLRDHLQPEMMPELLARGIILPNKQSCGGSHAVGAGGEGAGVVQEWGGEW